MKKVRRLFLLFLSFLLLLNTMPLAYSQVVEVGQGISFGFKDSSFDPVDEITGFSGKLDKVIHEKSIWQLYKYKDGKEIEYNIQGIKVLNRLVAG